MEMSNQHLAIFASFNLPDLFVVFSDSIKNLTACQQKWDKTWAAVSIMDVNMTTMTVGGMISGMITHQTGLHSIMTPAYMQAVWLPQGLIIILKGWDN